MPTLEKVAPVPRFYRDSAGNFLGTFEGASPPEGAIEVLEPPAHAAQRWAADAWQPLPGPTVRQARRVAYVSELGKEPTADPVEVIGDVLDVVIAELTARDQIAATAEFGDMVRKIAAIKARFPKG